MPLPVCLPLLFSMLAIQKVREILMYISVCRHFGLLLGLWKQTSISIMNTRDMLRHGLWDSCRLHLIFFPILCLVAPLFSLPCPFLYDTLCSSLTFWLWIIPDFPWQEDHLTICKEEVRKHKWDVRQVSLCRLCSGCFPQEVAWRTEPRGGGDTHTHTHTEYECLASCRIS
jgi:hypothetical protein